MNPIEQKNIETIERLRNLLMQTEKWPVRYMFKFIVPNSNDRVNRVVATLPANGNTSFRPSKDIHYVCVTHVCQMASADDIVAAIHRATAIDGVISL